MHTKRKIDSVLKEVSNLNFDQRISKLHEMEIDNRGDVRDHSEGVAHFSAKLAERIGFSTEDVDNLVLAARLHDIGKLTTPDQVLRKPGRLDDKERAIMTEHTRAGLSLLGPDAPRVMKDVALYHHERYDGFGYEQLRGENIPLEARIVAITDTHDALVKKRDYKDGMSEGEALSIMTADKASPEFGRRAFDPYLLRVFVSMRLSDPAIQVTPLERERLTAFSQSEPMSDFPNGFEDNEGWLVKSSGHRLKYGNNDKGQKRLVEMRCQKGTTELFSRTLDIGQGSPLPKP